MRELEILDVYACALSMPNPDFPVCEEWTEEIARHVERNKNDEIYLIGHSLGVPAILRYLETASETHNIKGVFLISGPSEKNSNPKVDSFLEKSFDFSAIKSKAVQFIVIHGDNDLKVPISNARFLSKELNGKLIIVPNGGHLNGPSGFVTLPQLLESFKLIAS